MSGLHWPHLATPQGVQTIADRQVYLWEREQKEHPDHALHGGGKPVEHFAPGLPRQGNRSVHSFHDSHSVDRYGFHFWGDAMVTELSRVLRAGTHATSNPTGYVEDPLDIVEHARAKAAGEEGPHISRRHFLPWRAARK